MGANKVENSAPARRHDEPRRGAAGALMLGAALTFNVALGHAATNAQELQAFHSDGCSLFPDRDPLRALDWCHCCFAHDLAYWRGGSEAERHAADLELERCVAAATGDEKLAATMFAGVRAGGSPWFVTPYRWGYGWPFGRGYTPLSDAEQVRAERLAEAAPSQLAAACGRGDATR